MEKGSGIEMAAIKCPKTYAIQAKYENTIMINEEHVNATTGNNVLFSYKYPAAEGVGLICDHRPYTWANNGPAQTCKDYSVRFCCPKEGELSKYELAVTFLFLA